MLFKMTQNMIWSVMLIPKAVPHIFKPNLYSNITFFSLEVSYLVSVWMHHCFYKLIFSFKLIPVCFSPGSSAPRIEFECLHSEFCFLLPWQLHCLFFTRPGQVTLLERSVEE